VKGKKRRREEETERRFFFLLSPSLCQTYSCMNEIERRKGNKE